MSKPVLVATSEGYINLAAVVHIDLPRKEQIRFVFGGGTESGGEEGMSSYWVSLPDEEGMKIIRALEREKPDWFLSIE
jgi:hypothetical protein